MGGADPTAAGDETAGAVYGRPTSIQDHLLDNRNELVPATEIHDICTRRILGTRINALGEQITMSTIGLGEDGMAEYINTVQRISADEWGVQWDSYGRDA